MWSSFSLDLSVIDKTKWLIKYEIWLQKDRKCVCVCVVYSQAGIYTLDSCSSVTAYVRVV